LFRIYLFTPKPVISALYSDYPEAADAFGPRVSDASPKWGGGGGGGLSEGSGAIDPITPPAKEEFPPDPPLPARPAPRERDRTPPRERDEPVASPPVDVPPPGGSFPSPRPDSPRESAEPLVPAGPVPTEEGGATAPNPPPLPRIPEPCTAVLLALPLLVRRRR
jgi:hypothetical protein